MTTEPSVEQRTTWRDRMRQAPSTPQSYQQRSSQYSGRDGVDGGYISQYRADGNKDAYVDDYGDSSSRSLGMTQAERAWRQDSPMQYKQEQPLQAWKESSHSEPQQWPTSIHSSTGSFTIEEQKVHAKEVARNYAVGTPEDQSLQSRPSVPQQSSWASSGNSPSPKRPMNFSRPLRIAEIPSPSKARNVIVPELDEDENSQRDRLLEERLRRLELKNSSRPRTEENSRPMSQLQPQQQSPSRTAAQIPHSAKAYSRPALSPIPSAASSITLSQLKRLREVPEEEGSAEDDYNIPDGTTPTQTYHGFMPSDVQPNKSASSSATSFASQVSPVPITHYPAGIVPILDDEHNPVENSFKKAASKQPTPAAVRPPITTSRSDEAPIPVATHIPTASTSTTRTTETINSNIARSSNGDPHSNRTSATSSSQQSMDVDRITPVNHSTTSPGRPLSHHAGRTPFMINRPILSTQNSTASSSTTNGPPNSLNSLPVTRPIRTNSTTSSGATSAMEAFKASNYDVSSLTEKQVAKLKKKGIDPALYMEMKAATGGMGKDGKKRSKWSRALVGNTFIG